MATKEQVAKEFLRSLEDKNTSMSILTDRMEVPIIRVIENFAELLVKSKGRSDIDIKDIASSTMIIGYLLKSHMDRYDLNETLKLNIE